jgi:hypothetical protein
MGAGTSDDGRRLPGIHFFTVAPTHVSVLSRVILGASMIVLLGTVLP